VYQFRVRFKNDADYSDWSAPSHKVKTNKAEPPEVCISPTLAKALMAGDTAVILTIAFPPPGGAPISAFTIEYRDVDLNITLTQHLNLGPDRGDPPYQNIVLAKPPPTIEVTVAGLRSCGFFQFRVRAENKVGPGEYSAWGDEVEIPSDYVIN
jgi:hypothetical protein